MMIFCLAIVLVLAWSLGKNNLSNLFGVAVGTKMIPLRVASILAIISIFIGALFSGQATTSTLSSMIAFHGPMDILMVFISAFIIMEILSLCGIPASIVQTIIGATIGWNVYYRARVDWELVRQMVEAWFIAPLIASLMSLFLMLSIRKWFNKHPISIFKRDYLTRVGLIAVGVLASYTLGANNVGTMTAPFLHIFPNYSNICIVMIVCLAISVGCWQADLRVINTVGRKLFPLSPVEAFVVMLATSVSLMLFSMNAIRELLQTVHLPTLPLVPIPMSSVIIGAICGISLSKGGKGLRFSVFVRIISSWVIVPVLSGLICALLLIICGCIK